MVRGLYSPEQIKLQSILRQGRMKAGLTQARLADQLGKPQSFVAKYERGERRLDPIEFIRILRALDLMRIETLDEIVAAFDNSETVKRPTD